VSRRLTARTALLLFLAPLLAILAAAGGTAPAAAAAQAAPGVRAALPVGGSEQWWFNSWDIEKVWATGATGAGVTVAVLDSGVDANRPELKGVLVPGQGTSDGQVDTDRERAHGTAMARLIAGQGGVYGGAGVAPGAKIMPIDAGFSMTNVPGGIRYAVDHGAKIINMSIATNGSCSQQYQSKEMYAAVRYAVDRGALLVAGSGNNREYSDTYPASCPGVVTVGAINGQGQVWDQSFAAPYVAFTAPGVQMASLNARGQQVRVDGTSDSAALVSGALALIWSKYPELTNRQVLARLIATARDAGPAGRDDEYGFGYALPIRAVTENVPADAPNPIFDALDRAIPPGSTGAPSSGTAAGGPSGTASAPANEDGDVRGIPAGSGGGGGALPFLVGGAAVVLGGVLIAVWLIRNNRRRPTP